MFGSISFIVIEAGTFQLGLTTIDSRLVGEDRRLIGHSLPVTTRVYVHDRCPLSTTRASNSGTFTSTWKSPRSRGQPAPALHVGEDLGAAIPAGAVQEGDRVGAGRAVGLEAGSLPGSGPRPRRGRCRRAQASRRRLEAEPGAQQRHARIGDAELHQLAFGDRRRRFGRGLFARSSASTALRRL